MGHITFGQQIAQHLQFLRKAGLEVANLEIDSPEFIRCRFSGERGRGEYAYKTVSRKLDNGMTGLMSWCRSESGQVSTYKTYGHSSGPIQMPLTFSGKPCSTIHGMHQDADVERIQRFWELCSSEGRSDYLGRKGVGAYCVRFRENQHGRVAVVPLRDIQGKLRSYQILNANGSKVFAKGMRRDGLFHQLTELTDGLPIGIAESYVTAATCLELIAMPMVTAFSGDNLKQVAFMLQQRYPNSPLVIYADNDRHLDKNKGLISAFEALKQPKSGGIVLSPYFNGYPATHDYSDWNDLVREIGHTKAFEQIQCGLNNAQSEELRRWTTVKCNKALEL